MIPTIAHLYGPFCIKSYGFFISLGLVLTLWLANRDTQYALLFHDDQFITLILWCIGAALLGGRALYVITSWNTVEHIAEILELWHGGFSILGSMLAVLCFVLWYARKYLISLTATLDFFALYAPFMQSISRIGCFCAGCCYGKPTVSVFGITYHHPESMAPLGISLHPTQLYSSITLLSIFLVLYTVRKRTIIGSGMLTVLYLLLVSLERFCIDFLRGDQEFFSYSSLEIFSLHQWLSLCIFVGSLGYLLWVAYANYYESF